MRTKKLGAALALALLSTGAPEGARAEERYWITKVPTFGGGYVYARRLNASGDVAGNVQVPDASGALHDRAFLYAFGQGTMTLLDLGGGSSGVTDLNDAGQVLGWDSDPATGAWRAFLYDHGTYHDVGAAGLQYTNDLGAGGHVVGWSYGLDGNGHAAFWYAGAVTSLQAALAPLGEVASEAKFANARGEIVGVLWDGTAQRAFLYRGGTATLLPFDELITSEDGRFGPINENSMVAGLYTDAAGARHLATWWEGMTIDLGTGPFPNMYWSQYRGMNDRNDIFGYTWSDRLLLAHVFLFTWDDQEMHDPGSLGGYVCVHGVNNQGELAGHSRQPGDVEYQDPYGNVHGAGPNYVFTGGRMYDLNEVIAPGSGLVFSSYDGVLNDAGQVLVPGDDGQGQQVPVVFTPFPSTAVILSGTLRADGWYTSNVSPRLAATALPGVREIRYRIDGGPWTTAAGAAVDLPRISQQGTHVIAFSAVDTLGHVEAPRTVTVSVDKGGLVTRTTALRAGTVGEAYAAAVSASGGTAPYTFSVASGRLPAGLALRTDGRLSGTPTAAGTSQFEVKVVDAKRATSRAFLALEVLEPLRVTTPRYVQGGALTATGGKPPYTWAVDAATPLPETMGLDFATVLGALPGSEPVTARFVVTDAYGKRASAEMVFGFTPVSAWLESGATAVAVGDPIALAFGASGGMGATTGYTWSIAEGLPAWLSLDAGAGVLAGTAGEPGTWTFLVVARDGAGNASEPLAVTLTVQ